MRLSAPAAAAVAAVMLNATGCGAISSIKMPWSHTSPPAAAAAPAPALAAAPAPAITAAPSAPTADEGEPIDRVLATVDGNPITTHDVKSFTAKSGGAVAAMAQPGGAATPSDPQEVLQALITEVMLDNEALKYITKLDESEVDRYVQNVEQQNHMTDEQLRAQLQAQGISYDAFRANIRRQVATMAMIDREVRQKIVIPDSDIEAYYKAHPDEFTVTEERYRLAQILIAVPSGATPEQAADAQKRAEDIRKQAEKGANFGDLAREHSDDDSKAKGGELGVFAPNELNDEIAAAVAGLKPGEISKVVHTKYGFHIVKVEEHEKPGLRHLDEVKSAIRDKLMTEQAKTKFQSWIDRDLKRRHLVETVD